MSVYSVCVFSCFFFRLGLNVIDISDVSNYPSILTQNTIDKIIRSGPIQIKMQFPSTNGRAFSAFYYTKIMSNGETINREWIVYSRELDAVHCFCCRIFEPLKVKFSSINGVDDWKHLSERIRDHETSASHLNNYTKWKSAAKLHSTDKTIEIELLKQFQTEKQRLKEVFKRIIALVLYLARQNLAFTGSSSKIHDEAGRNGNFHQLVQTVASFDCVMREHLDRNETVHYLSPKTQNELINIIGLKVKSHILNSIKENKYFSMILDSTPDVTRNEQMTLVLRHVLLNERTQKYGIKESFIEFMNIFDKTGAGIADVISNELKSLGLDINNLRGQAYDNGSNMKGKNIGVQKQILQMNPRAMFVACCDHSLNLALNDAAEASGATVGFFSLVQHIYVFLSGSTGRWDVLKSHLEPSSTLVPKNLCTTRWSSRIDAVKPLRRNIDRIRAALYEINNSDKFDPKICHEAGCIADKIDFTFICCVCTWHDILYQINIASKTLQSIQSSVQTAMTCLKSVLTFLESYSTSGFQQMWSEANEIAEHLGIAPELSESGKRPSRLRALSSENDFRENFFAFVIDVATKSVKERFESLENVNGLFSFLYDFESCDENLANGNLKKSCKKLELALSHNDDVDINGDDLFHEFPVVYSLIKQYGVSNALDVLNTIKKAGLENLVPNMVIAYRIFLTTPVSVASGERSFSKLKLIKDYLRNSTKQERLNGLAIISIEREIANSIDYEDIIEDFAHSKARKKPF